MTGMNFDNERKAIDYAAKLVPPDDRIKYEVVMRPNGLFCIVATMAGEWLGLYGCKVNNGVVTFGIY